MSVVTYQCTVCKRQRDIVQNQQGLDWIGHCNITLGCRGTLYQIDVHPDFIRGKIPADVQGLKNWVQRKVLFNFTQTIARNSWTITHNLGTLPSVDVFIDQPTQANPTNQVQILPEEIIYNTDDTLTLMFPQAYSGIAQLIARASNPDILNPRPIPPVVNVVPTIQLSNAGTLTIATRISSIGTPTNVTLTLQYILGTNGNSTDITYTTNVPADTSPWFDTRVVIVKGKTYTVRTFNIQTLETTTGQIANGSWVQLIGFNSVGTISIPVISVELAPTNSFTVADDLSLFFTKNTVFETTGTGGSNDRPWVVVDSIFDPITDQTTVTVSDPMSGSFTGAIIVDSGVRQIDPNEIIILLGSPPFTIFDKITSSFVDFTAVNTPATQFDIFFNAGDLFASATVQQTVYPPIRSVS
jgi:hypothetical protein